MYLPLVNYLRNDQHLQAKQGTKFLGVLGCQGSGKTLLSKMINLILESQNKKVLYFSSDDFYLQYAQRRELMHKLPFLKFRYPEMT